MTFIHMFRYALKILLRSRENIFWSLIFPLILTTFMYLAFGNLFATTEQFSTIPVAVVWEQEDPVWETMLQAVSEESEEPLLHIQKTTREEAEELLEDDKIKGILVMGSSPSLHVKDDSTDLVSLEQTMLQMILNQFLQYETVITDAAKSHPETIPQIVQMMGADSQSVREIRTTSGNLDNSISYFYAVLAMVCLFASFAGSQMLITIQADQTAIGQRRSMIPVHKAVSILADFAACETVQYAVVLLVLVYMKLVLKLELGEKTVPILILLFLGTSFGIMLGMFVGSLPFISPKGKIGVLCCFDLILCFMSDLMVQGLKNQIEHILPIVNDLNPAALICDSFYALNIYDTYARFGQNMLLLGGETAVLLVLCYLLVRRSRYASL